MGWAPSQRTMLSMRNLLYILLESKSFHILSNTIPPCLPRALSFHLPPPIVVHCLIQSMSSVRTRIKLILWFWCVKNLGCTYLLALRSSDPLQDNGQQYHNLVRFAASTSHELIPCSYKSSLNVVCHVFFGLPLLPSSGVQFIDIDGVSKHRLSSCNAYYTVIIIHNNTRTRPCTCLRWPLRLQLCTSSCPCQHRLHTHSRRPTRLQRPGPRPRCSPAAVSYTCTADRSQTSKPGFHYPSWQVSITCQHGSCWRVCGFH